MCLTRNRCAGRRLKADIHQPIDETGCMIDEGTQHDGVDAVFGDALGIAKMFIGTVVDTDAALQPGARRADLA